MKIAFLAPAGAMHRYNGNFGHTLHYAPLTLTTLAALVPPEVESELVIYDETAQKIPQDLVADLICITVITGTAMRCYAYADMFRSRGIPVAMGGVHVSMLPEEASQHADIIFTGFAEYTFPQMIRDFVQGKARARYDQEPGFHLEHKVIPRRDLLKKHAYITTNTLEAVRGCSLPCTFCAYPTAFGRTVHKREVAEVIQEVLALKSRLILFPDVNLMADRAYAKQLFSALIPHDKQWMGLVTSHIGLDDEMLRIFEKSGCKGLLIGFESITQNTQGYINKGVNQVSDYGELMKKLHDRGILVQGCFAFGSDEEDASVFERTLEMVTKTKIDLPRYSILTPFPKTKLYADLEAEGRIFERDWAMYDVEHCVFIPKKMTVEQLIEGISWTWENTYSMKNIAQRLWPFERSPWLSLPVNLGYKTYADKYRYFTREVMTDNSDIEQVRT